MTEPRSLYYYYENPAEYRARTDHLSPVARSAYKDLRDSAWMAEQREAPPCSLPDDDVQLARFARLELREWKKVSRDLRVFFVSASDLRTRGALLVERLMIVDWYVALEAYEARASAGSKGGRTKAENVRRKKEEAASNASSPASSNATTNASSGGGSKPVAEGYQPKLNGVVPPATHVAGVVPSPAPHAAPSPVGAAPRGSSARMPYTPPRDESAEDPAQRERAARYRRVLQAEVDKWLFLNPPLANEMEAALRSRMGLPATGLLTPAKSRVVQEAMLEEVRAHNNWPPLDAWSEKHPDMVPVKSRASPSNASAALAGGQTP